MDTGWALQGKNGPGGQVGEPEAGPPHPIPRIHTPSTQNTMCVLGEVQGGRKKGILPNKPHPSTPSQTEPSHSPHKKTEAQRGIAVGSGFHSVWRQSEAQDLGSHSQGLDSSHDARGHLLPTQQECPGLTTPQTPPSPPTQGEAAGRSGPALSPRRMLEAALSSQTPMPRSAAPEPVQRVHAGTASTKLFLPV